MGLCMCFILFKINNFFYKALLDPVLPGIAMKIFYFKNSIIARIIFFVMNLNLYLTSA